MAARYSRFERRFWRDEKVRKLSEQAKLLMAYLLTCDANDGFPGLFLLRLSAAAEDLDWSTDTVRLRLGEIERLGMARRDDDAAVMWLPNAVRKWVDQVSTSNVKGWRRAWAELPDCPIVRAAFARAVDDLAAHEDEAKGRILVAEFTKRPPAWFGHEPRQIELVAPPLGGASTTPRPPLDHPSTTPRGGLDHPPTTPRGGVTPPVEQEQGQGQGQGQGGGHPPATPLRPKPVLTEAGQDLFADLAEERDDLFPGVPDDDLARAAAQMARRIERDSAGRAHGGPYLGDAIAALPAWIAENATKSPVARLAEVVRKFGFRVGDDAPEYPRGAGAMASLRVLQVAS